MNTIYKAQVISFDIARGLNGRNIDRNLSGKTKRMAEKALRDLSLDAEAKGMDLKSYRLELVAVLRPMGGAT